MGFRRGVEDRLVLLGVEAADEMANEGRNVFLAFAQGGHLDRENVETIEQVLAEIARRHLFGQIAVGRRNDANIHLDRAFGTDRIDFAFLQRAQQLDLHVERQFADLVQEERAAIGLLELAHMLADRTREGALLVTEQGRLHEIFGNGTAVHGDEGAVCPLGRRP